MLHILDIIEAHQSYEKMPEVYRSILDGAFDKMYKELKKCNIYLDPTENSELVIAALHKAIQQSINPRHF